VLAAQDDPRLGVARLDGVDQPNRRRPLVREDHRDPDQLGVGGDPPGDLVERQPEQVALEVAAERLGRLGDGVDERHPLPGRLQRPGDEREAQGRRDRRGREAERLDRGRSDQADRRAVTR
jgi:hypothetical protein